jgi:acetyl esterase/lipase
MGAPDIRVVRAAWKVMDSWIMRWCSTQLLPFLRVIPKLAVHNEFILSGTDSEGSPMLQTRTLRTQKGELKTVKILLLSARPLEISVNKKLRRSASSGTVRNYEGSSPVIIYFHGGGFVSDFRASELYFLSQWASATGLPIVYIDYSLAPENAYPTALNECYDVYKWVVEGRLGIRPNKIILAGDSVGGNLAVGTSLRCIMEKERLPDSLLLAYPILNLKHAPTPSRALFMMDAILPMNLLNQCRAVYLPSHFDTTDPLLSPVLASDELIRKLPPTNIMVGAFDPFLDDSVDFAHRLHANGVPCRLKVFQQLPHSFWNFALFLSDARRAVRLGAEWIQTAL